MWILWGSHFYLYVCVCGLNMYEHSLPLVVSERDPLSRHFEVDDSGRRRGVHGESLCGRLLHRLMSCQRLQRHRPQVPHITRCNTHTHNKGTCQQQNEN